MELNSTSCSFGDGEAPGETAVLMEGYHYHWDQLSHRISYLKAGVGVPDDDGSAVGHLGLLGGPWSDGRRFVDLPSYGLGYAHLQSSEVTAWYGHVPLRIPSGGRIEEPVSVSLSDLDLPQREHWLVALAGFCFDTDVPGEGDFNNGYDPVDGWAIKDLAVGISPALATESTVDFVAAAELRGGTIDRDNHNEAMLHAQVDADLAYLVLGFDNGEVFDAGLGATTHHRFTDPLPSEERIFGEGQLSATIPTSPGEALALPLLRGWGFHLNRSNAEAGEGRYLRQLGATLSDFSYDSGSGDATIRFDAYASNVSSFPMGHNQVQFEADVSVLRLPADSGSYTRASVEGTLETLGDFDHPIEAQGPTGR